MRWFTGVFRTPIGVDVSDGQIAAAQLRRRHGAWCVEALSAIDRTHLGDPVGVEEARQLRSVLERQGFRGNDVVLSVPTGSLLTGILDLPPRQSGAPVDQIARMELSRMHRVQGDSFEVSYWALPESPRSSSSSQAMAVACSHDDANAVLDVFEDAGLNVLAMDAQIKAAARACRPALAPEPASTGILVIGWFTVSLAIITRNLITYERLVPDMGLGTLVGAVAKKYSLDHQGARRVLLEAGLGGYGGGLPRKEWLLRHEGAML